MRKRALIRTTIATLATCLTIPAHADPIHAIQGGGYWHHDSHWTFVREIAGFTMSEHAQDVAGSRDATGGYVFDGDIIARVDVVAGDSMEHNVSAETARAYINAMPESEQWTFDESTLRVGPDGAIMLARLSARSDRGGKMLALYFAQVGDWRVRISIFSPRFDPTLVLRFDEFVRGQRWDSLSGG